MEIGIAFLAIGDGLAFGDPVETHDRGGADHANLRVLVFQRQKLRFSAGGVGDEGSLILDTAIGVAVAEFRCAERVECLGVGRYLGLAERLDAFRDRVFMCRTR
jgi:hypothetical protein